MITSDKIFLSLILVCFTIMPVMAEEISITKGITLSLQECIDLAIRNNPNIGLAENLTKVYKSKIGQAKAGYYPQLNVSSGYGRRNSSTNSPVDNTFNDYSGNASLNQLIYDFGKTPTKVKIQDLNLTSSRYDVNDTVIQIAYNVKQAYYSALSSKLSKDVYEQAIKQAEQHLKQAKAFYEIGTKPKIDVTTADVALSNAKLNLIKANNAYKTTIARLNNAMGIPDAPEYNLVDSSFKKPVKAANEKQIQNKSENVNVKSEKKIEEKTLKSTITKFDFVDNLQFNKFNISFEDAIKTAYENRPDLKSLITKEEAAKESVNLAKKDYFPTVTGYAGYGFGGQKFPLDIGWSTGVNMTIPVFNGFLTKNQIDEAKASLDIAKSNIDILKQDIYFQVQQAYINLIEAEKRIPVAEMTVKQAKENLDLASGRYSVGVGNIIEVQDAEVNYNNSQLAYIQAFYDYNIAKSNLEKVMGMK